MSCSLCRCDCRQGSSARNPFTVFLGDPPFVEALQGGPSPWHAVVNDLMPFYRPGSLLLIVTALGALLSTASAADAAPDDYDRLVRPILSERCFTCHGPDEGARQANLRLDTEEGAFAKLSSGSYAIVRGNASASALIERITSREPARRMPPAYAGLDKLPEDEIDLLRRWIDEGAPWSKHWSFVSPVRPELPAVSQPAWLRSAIDNFVMAKLDREGLQPAKEADRRTLLRRLSLDLTGLPPTPAEVESFAADASANAYEKAVDRLLASPHYGEQMAIWWLDAARYSDTNGYQSDGFRTMWPWRDWVVRAFNRNQPFDEFTIEQIAGDLLPNATLPQKVATAFNRNHRTTAEGGSVEEEFLAEYAADRVATTSTVWLGLTVGCARCHDHKYDPLKQQEFYQLFAYFDNIPERGLVYNFGNDEPTIKVPSAEQQQRLADLDRQVEEAETRLRGLEPEIAAGVKAWAAELQRSSKEIAWSPGGGLVYHAALDRGKVDFVESKKPKKAKISTNDGDGKRSSEPGPRKVELVEGRFGAAAMFGERRYAEVGDVAAFDYNDAFSFSFWIYPESADGAILNRMEDAKDPQGLGLFLSSGKLRFELTKRHTDLSMRIVSKQPLDLRRWQHVTVTYTGELPSSSGARFYVDGEMRDFDIEWDDLKWPISYTTLFRLGAGGGRESFQGRLDELRIYNRSLSAEEAGILAVADTLKAIAALDETKRSKNQADKLRRAYLEWKAPRDVRQALASLKMARERRRLLQESIPTLMIMEEDGDRPTHILRRGSYDMPGDEVEPDVPEVLPPLPPEGGRNRLGLARWLVDRSNPLTARVTVNRFWQTLFGVGLVKTVDDFGSQGERPSHPELLDWLAVEFMESGWNVKHLLKTIVMSATYRQSSKTRPELLERDPENRLLARGSRFRLPAETIRDQALAVAGLLNPAMGGPPVKPYQPPGLWAEVSSGEYQRDSGEALYRRSLYTYWRRTVPPPSMMAFDAADRETCRVQRTRTNTPLQALTLMNDVTYVEAGRKLAERMMKEGGEGSGERIAYGFHLVNGRPPEPGELAVIAAAFQQFREAYGKDRASAKELLGVGEAPRDKELDPRQLASYTAVANLLLNTDEAVTRE